MSQSKLSAIFGLIIGLLSAAPVEAASYEQEVMADNPYAYYRFEEASGPTAIDSSGNGHIGQYRGGLEFSQPSAGPGLGTAVLFDGVSGYVQLPALGLESPQLTIETWLNLATLASGCCTSIFSPDGWQPGWLHYNLKGDSNIEFALNSGGPNNHNTEPGIVPYDEWTHIASVYDADEAIVQTFVNGEQVDVFPEDFATPLDVSLVVNAQIAAWQNTRFLGGLLDEFAIYDSVLTPERILAHYHAASSVALPGDYNNDGEVNSADADAQAVAMKAANPDLTVFDENDDQVVNADDRWIWVHDHAGTWVGDANLDGQFNSTDFVDVFLAGKYESGTTAGWAEGDWDGSMLFASGDFVAAFLDGGYEIGPRPQVGAVPEPASVSLVAMVLPLLFFGGRRRWQ